MLTKFPKNGQKVQQQKSAWKCQKPCQKVLKYSPTKSDRQQIHSDSIVIDFSKTR